MTIVITHSGKVLDFADPRSSSITRADVATGLSGACRFAAQTAVFYSVAQHAVMVAQLVEMLDSKGLEEGQPRAANLLAALHHDSHEAFMGDVPAPLKELLPDYTVLASRLDVVILEALGLRPSSLGAPVGSVLSRADMIARCVEAENINPAALNLVRDTAGSISDDELALGRELWIGPLPPPEARKLFLVQEDYYRERLESEAELRRDSLTPEQLMEELHVLDLPLPWFSE